MQRQEKSVNPHAKYFESFSDIALGDGGPDPKLFEVLQRLQDLDLRKPPEPTSSQAASSN